MAQESYEISPQKLAYYRDKAGLSQEQLSERAGLSRRQYQRIEREGRTTLQKARSLARVLGIDVDVLGDTSSPVLSDWFVITPEGKREFTKYYSDFFESIKCKAKIGISAHGSDCNIELHIDNVSPVCKTVTVKFPLDGAGYVWAFYPARFSPEDGVLWRKFTEWLEVFWEKDIKTLKLDACYHVFIDGQPVVPAESETYYCVEFFKPVQKEDGSLVNEYQGYQLFENHYQLSCSFADWFTEGDGRYFEKACTVLGGEGKLLISYKGSRSLSPVDALIVSRVWVGGQGERKQAPWLSEHIKAVAESLNKPRFDESGWYFPVAVVPMERGFQHPGDDYCIPAMLPENEPLGVCL